MSISITYDIIHVQLIAKEKTWAERNGDTTLCQHTLKMIRMPGLRHGVFVAS